MEHDHIQDRDITASSTFDYHSVGPHMGRARQDAKGGAWCPAQTISHGVREWIEINLHTDYRITAAETMGRFGGGQGQEFAETYQIEYWRAGSGKNTLAIYPQVFILCLMSGAWHRYTNTSGHHVLKGNTNTYMAHRQDLHPPIVASRVRFLPYSVSGGGRGCLFTFSLAGASKNHLHAGRGVWLSVHLTSQLVPGTAG